MSKSECKIGVIFDMQFDHLMHQRDLGDTFLLFILENAILNWPSTAVVKWQARFSTIPYKALVDHLKFNIFVSGFFVKMACTTHWTNKNIHFYTSYSP